VPPGAVAHRNPEKEEEASHSAFSHAHQELFDASSAPAKNLLAGRRSDESKDESH